MQMAVKRVGAGGVTESISLAPFGLDFGANEQMEWVTVTLNVTHT